MLELMVTFQLTVLGTLTCAFIFWAKEIKRIREDMCDGFHEMRYQIYAPAFDTSDIETQYVMCGGCGASVLASNGFTPDEHGCDASPKILAN